MDAMSAVLTVSKKVACLAATSDEIKVYKTAVKRAVNLVDEKVTKMADL